MAKMEIKLADSNGNELSFRSKKRINLMALWGVFKEDYMRGHVCKIYVKHDKYQGDMSVNHIHTSWTSEAVDTAISNTESFMEFLVTTNYPREIVERLVAWRGIGNIEDSIERRVSVVDTENVFNVFGKTLILSAE